MIRLPILMNCCFFLVAFLASQAAAIRLLDSDWEDVELGQPFALRWADEGQDGVNIFLSQGPATNLVRVSQLGSESNKLRAIPRTNLALHKNELLTSM
jgi:hypothetical protein